MVAAVTTVEVFHHLSGENGYALADSSFCVPDSARVTSRRTAVLVVCSSSLDYYFVRCHKRCVIEAIGYARLMPSFLSLPLRCYG